MSASREKQKRKQEQELGISKEQIKEKEAQKTRRRRTRSIVVIVVILVLAIGAFCVYNDSIPFFAGRLLKDATAVQIGTEEFTAADFNYYFNSIVNEYKTNYKDYFSFLGIDTEADFLNQAYDDTQTWGDLFKKYALEQLKEIGILASEAEKAGFTLTDAEMQNIDDFFAQLGSYASNMGMSIDNYFQQQFGGGVTQEVYRRNMMRSTLATSYKKAKSDSFTYTGEQMEQYYAENQKTVDVTAYRYFFVSGIAASDEDEEQALADSKTDAEAFVRRLGEGEKFSDLCVEYATDIARDRYAANENESLKPEATYGTTLDSFRDWVYDDARREGDVTYVEGNPDESYTGYFVVQFISRGRADYNTVNYRSILSSVSVDDEDTYNEAHADDTDAQTYDEYVDAAWVAAQEAIEKIEADWQKNGGDEDEFAKLATSNSDDESTYSGGGLVEQAPKYQEDDQMEAWLFDPSRKSGDFQTFETSEGMRLVYFVSADLPRWQTQIMDTLRESDYKAWYEGVSAGYEVKEKRFGMHYALQAYES